MNNISGLTVTFEPPVNINNRTIDKIIITKVIDDLDKKRAVAMCYNYKPVILWEGVEYNEAGQWTDSDVIQRVKQIVIHS